MVTKRRTTSFLASITVAIIVTFGVVKLFSIWTAIPRKTDAEVPRFSISGVNEPNIDKNTRLAPTIRPSLPQAQHPQSPTSSISLSPNTPETSKNPDVVATQPAPLVLPTPQNTDVGKSPQEWERLTDDWNGLRPDLEEHGITFAGGFTGYLGKNLADGSDTRDFGESYLVNVNVTLDSKKLLRYDGGIFFINFQSENGLPEHSLDGSFGDTSHLYSPDRNQVSEIWYEQKLLDDKLRLKLGKIDANSDFAFVANGGEFLNDFSSNSATILDFPTDPDPAFGAEAFVYPTSHLYAGIGVFDGSALEGVHTGSYGLAEIFHDPSHFCIGEAGATWTLPGERDGRLGIGVWHHTGTFDRFDGGNQNGATGPYLTFDQTLWRTASDSKDTAPGIGVFALVGYANPAVSAANYQLSGGLRWTGPLPSRDSDVLGLGASYIRFSADPGTDFDHRGEFTIEMFYKIRFNSWMSIQPDLQFIQDPGDLSSHDNALAATIQLIADF